MENKLMDVSNKRGYLNEDYLIFHLKDKNAEKFEYHYHDFYKIIIFISGKVDYLIEGKTYKLKPWDILLITNQDIHRAAIETSEFYERIVIWLKPEFLQNNSTLNTNLLQLFEPVYENTPISGLHSIPSQNSYIRQNLLRLEPEKLKTIKYFLREIEKNSKENGFGSDIAKKSIFLLLMVYLNKCQNEAFTDTLTYDLQYDDTITKVVNYINANLSENLNIEALAENFYISKYTLMHNFKKQTGFTIHSFILHKRLLKVGSLIEKDTPIIEASLQCGFGDYSSFVKAFKKFYGVSPRDFSKTKNN